MAGQKRVLDESSSVQKSKKSKTTDSKPERKQRDDQFLQTPSNLTNEDIDFPRGGGTSFTPLEVKAIRAEAVKEADKELFGDAKKVKKKKSKIEIKPTPLASSKKDTIRIEHLNYKRINPGMRILGQIVSIQPLALILSLPNQLMGHVPVTQISSQFTHRLENMDENSDPTDSENDAEGEAATSSSHVPDLFEMFQVGQYVRAVVTAVHPAGTSGIPGFARSRDDAVKGSRRVELSLEPDKVNAGVQTADLNKGFTLSAAVKSIEDHGYIIDMGISEISGFLSLKDTRDGGFGETKLQIGRILDVTIAKMSANGRTCSLSADRSTFVSSTLSEVANVTSILPGMLVQCLITSVLPTGLNLQIVGFFEGTVDENHFAVHDSEKAYKVGGKVKARVLYDISSTSPTRFALALADHIVNLRVKEVSGEETSEKPSTIQEAFPVGTIAESVKVKRVEAENGLIVEVLPGLDGFVHISQTSDDHVPSLSSSSGSWKIGTTHRARVTGHHPFDGLLQLSLRPSVLDQKFLQAGDIHVGEVLKGSIKRLTDSALFISISGNVDGVIWPNHYADIPLKHPSKRFKPGGSIKCRVLTVDPERRRVFLTAKKTLIETSLPIVTSFDEAKPGVVTHAVVFKVSEKTLQIEFFNNIKAIVPVREASEDKVNLPDAFAVGKVVRVRILHVDADQHRIVASLRQAASNYHTQVADISAVEIGHTVDGVVSEIHKLNAVLTLRPTQARALVSLKNLAHHRDTTLDQLKTSLTVGDEVEHLVVVSRNPEKGFVVVAGKPKTKASLNKGSLSMETVKIGQIVGGRVAGYGRSGALVKLTARITGSLHPTDTCDNYDLGIHFPAVDSILKAAVIQIDESKKHLTLSTRSSRLSQEEGKVIVDREINDLAELKHGDEVRGFIKSIVEHGLFIMLGRGIDARIQIKELFDDYVKDWKSRFRAHQLVKGRILSVDIKNKKVEMTLKSGSLDRDEKPLLTLDDIHKGQKIRGRVKKIESYGLFIEIERSKISGLCHKSELSDNKDADVSVALGTFREGDKVQAVVLSVDRENRKLSFGLKPSYFTDEDFAANAEKLSAWEHQMVAVRDDEIRVEDVNMEEDDDIEAPQNHQTDDEDEDEDGMEIITESIIHRNPSVVAQNPLPHVQTSLKLEGFNWFDNATHSNDDEVSEPPSDETEEEEGAKKKKKKRRRKEIEQDVTADLQTKTPDSNADFERLLLGSPNSSYLWIQYMSFQLQIAEIDKAREIGRRALKTINFREEQEKLNVWVALLNLENVYGTGESLEATFKDAARHNDSKTIHLRLASILDQSEKYEQAEAQYQRTCKKFGQSSKVWTLFGEYYLRRGETEESRKLLSRSLQSLEKRKHLKTISKFAQLEYKFGDPERGKTIFEGIVDSHPKRWDLWSIYMDMQAGQGDIQSLRNLFSRVLALKMTSHKAKSFFKKWLELERRLGDEEGAAAVKEKAIEWTKMAANAA